MPKSFLVRLRPSVDDVSHQNSKYSKYKIQEKTQSGTNAQPYDATLPNQTATAPEHTMLNENHQSQDKYLPLQPSIAKSPLNNQSNFAPAMTSQQISQSAIDATRARHYVRPSFERAMPVPSYPIMPYISGWTQYDCLPSNMWYYPFNNNNNIQLQKYPRKSDRPLYSGAVSFPVFPEKNATDGTQQYSQRFQDLESEQQRPREVSTFPKAFKEFFSVGHKLKTNHPDDDLAIKSTTVLEVLPREHARLDCHIQKPTVQLPSEESKQESQEQVQKNEPFTSLQTNASSANSCETPSSKPDVLKAQQSDPEKTHRCEQCDKTFNRSSNLRVHMKTHSDHKPYKCDYCGKGFHQKIDKRIHHYTHTGEKPHKCTKCGRGFKQLTHLNYHMRTHSDTHMYHCSYCGKGFNQKGNLQAHIYGHTGQRPFKCEICSKGFTLRSTLNTHVRTHAPKKPFVCEYCNKAFYQKNALKMHHIASHPIVNGKSIL